MKSMFQEYCQREHAAKLSTHTPEHSRRFNPICYDDDDDYDYKERNEELNTILEKESDEFIKSSVKDLIQIPSESEDTSKSKSVCTFTSCDDFSPIDVPEEKVITFSNPLFNLNDDFISSNDESLSDENVQEDNVKIYSNSLFEFDNEYISSDVNPLFDEDKCFNSGGDVDEINNFENGYYDSEGDILYLESLLNADLVHCDPSIPAMSVASILEGFTDEPPFKDIDDLFDLEYKNDDWKKILIVPDFEDSRAYGFVHLPLELQSLAYGNPIS
nr:hypothetical protein [Tanacetum cinerariifolium]